MPKPATPAQSTRKIISPYRKKDRGGGGVVVDVHQRDRDLKDTWGKWLDEMWGWEWFVSLTFKDPIGEWGAERRWKDWFRFLRHSIGHRIEYVRVTEYQERGVPHYHAFVLNTDNYRRLTAKDVWEFLGNGYSRVLPYKRGKGASWYLAKYLTKELELGSIVSSRNLGRFRKTDQVIEIEAVLGDVDVLHSPRTKAHKLAVAKAVVL